MRKALLKEPCRFSVIALCTGWDADVAERERHVRLVPELSIERQALLVVPNRPGEVAEPARERPGSHEQLRAERRSSIGARRHRGLEPATPLGLVAAHLPEAPGRRNQPQMRLVQR